MLRIPLKSEKAFLSEFRERKKPNEITNSLIFREKLSSVIARGFYNVETKQTKTIPQKLFLCASPRGDFALSQVCSVGWQIIHRFGERLHFGINAYGTKGTTASCTVPNASIDKRRFHTITTTVSEKNLFE